MSSKVYVHNHKLDCNRENKSAVKKKQKNSSFFKWVVNNKV